MASNNKIDVLSVIHLTTQAIHAAFNVMFGMLETRPELCGDLHDNK